MEGTNSNTDLINCTGEEGVKVIQEDSCYDCEIVTENDETRQKTPCSCENELDIADSIDVEGGDDDDSATASSPALLPKIDNRSNLIHGKRINAKLRTSKDVYDRLKWDSQSITIQSSNKEYDTLESLDTSSIYIGYKDRFLGMCELPLEEYNPGGDIPFHRIYYFRTGGPPVLPFIGKDGEVKVREDNLPEGAVFIWDRESRTDLVFKSGNSTVSY